MDYRQAAFRHGEFRELDAGFEFYAPQTTLAEDGRRLLFGWMGVPEQDEEAHPTRRYGWIHTMTCPRELSLRHGRLQQRPARELQQLRGERTCWQGRADGAPACALGAAELQLAPQGAFNAAFGDAMTLNWDGERLRLTRASWPTASRSTVTGAARSRICSCCSIVPAWRSSSTTARP
ncbi:hypothetical protein IC615_00675 [Serratia ureilytica]